MAAVLCLLFTAVMAVPLGPLPALGPTFNPVAGVFSTSPREVPERLTLSGLHEPVLVDEDAHAIPHIFARDDHDLFYVEGYLVARDRLVEMDLMRRQAQGRLAEVLGPGAVPGDTLQVTLGLRRTAEASAARLARDDPDTYAALQAYCDGVNAWISQVAAANAWDVPFRLLGYRPQPWTPTDALSIQVLMAQTLALDMSPVARALIAQKLGAARADALFPTYEVNEQKPYAPGPYPPADPPDTQTLARAELDFGSGAGVGGWTGAGRATARSDAKATLPAGKGKAVDPAQSAKSGAAGGLAAILEAFSTMASSSPVQAALQLGLDRIGNSNNWAVDGTLTDTGKPYLAGDPHLALTLPSIWYEAHLESPEVHAYGVIIPGLPGILIGHNRDVAWSLTNVQNQQTFFYSETTSRDHPGEYLHNGRWLPFSVYREDIAVKGGETRHLEIPWTVHGPVVSNVPTLSDHGFAPPAGLTLSMAYTGNLYSDDLGAVLRLVRAENAADVKRALSLFGSPTQNFAYATRQGDIGIISAGFYPTVPAGASPWLPMPGTGRWDWTGLIPYERIPQIANPPWHYVFSANQREVGPDYPYYIGTSATGFDAGYRARTIQDFLADPANHPVTREKMADLQASDRDALAGAMVPVLLQAVAASKDASADVRDAAERLAGWDDVMRKDEAAPAIWWTFLDRYVKDTFGPWWKAARLEGVPDLQPEPGGAYVEALEAMTVAPPGSDAYRAVAYPGGSDRSWFYDPVKGVDRTRDQVMVQALGEAVADLRATLGADANAWQWGALHHREIPSLTGVAALGRGPYPANGDRFTPNAAGGEPSNHGPSWRMIADLSNWSRSWGVYPGGELGDATSPYYADFVGTWLAKGYKALPFPAEPRTRAGEWARRVIRLEPGGAGSGEGGSR